MLHLKNVKGIVDWMDDRECRLIDCFNGKVKNYTKAEFLKDLAALAQYIKNDQLITEKFGWNGLNICRCIKGLKGLSAASSEVQDLLNALTGRMEASGVVLDAQAIGNALYGLQKMDATSQAVQALITALVNKGQLHNFEALEKNSLAAKQIIASYLQLTQGNNDLKESFKKLLPTDYQQLPIWG